MVGDDAAWQRLERYAVLDPTNLRLLADLADLHLRAGRWAQARDAVQRALRHHPDDGPSAYRLALIDHAEGRLDAARRGLERLLGRGIDEPALRHELARVQADQRDWPAVDRTLATPPPAGWPDALAHPVLWLRLRALHHQGRVDEAIALGEAFAAARPAPLPVDLAATMATLYLDAGRIDDAARLLDTDAESGADHPELLAAGGYVAMHRGELDDALQRFERSSQRQPANGRAHLGAGLAHAMRGETNAALQALQRATETMPSHLGSWHALAWLHLLAKDVDAAERSFRSALAVDRNFGDTHGGLAIVAALRGDRAAAEQSLRIGQRLDAASMNVAVARSLLARGKGLDDPGVLEDGLKALDDRLRAGNGGGRRILMILLRTAQRARGSGAHD